MILRITSPAIRSPATGGTNEILPGTLPAPSPPPDTRIGFSFEYNTFRCSIPLARSSFHITLNSGHTLVSLISALLIRGIPHAAAFSATASFAVTVSIASMI